MGPSLLICLLLSTPRSRHHTRPQFGVQPGESKSVPRAWGIQVVPNGCLSEMTTRSEEPVRLKGVWLVVKRDSWISTPWRQGSGRMHPKGCHHLGNQHRTQKGEALRTTG